MNVHLDQQLLVSLKLKKGHMETKNQMKAGVPAKSMPSHH